jgi:transcription elongation factor Elf1
MNKKFRSPIWQINTNEFAKLVNQSRTIGDVLSYFGLRDHGSNYQTLVRRFQYEGIDYSKFSANKGLSGIRRRLTLDKILVENSSYSRNSLKQRLIKEGLLDNKCSKCGLEPEWQGQKLVMVIDHINGIHNDNRFQNLRLLCPNCNSQTTTFAGRNVHRKIYIKNCKGCGIKIKGTKKYKKYCKQCKEKDVWRKRPNLGARKITRPSKEELKKMLWEMPTTKIAERYGVSDKAVSKWAKTYELEKPPRGYWAQMSKKERLS